MKLLASFLTAFILLSSIALSQGEITDLSISPDQPIALENAKVDVSVQNPTTESKNYKLTILITSEGIVKSQKDFTFNLDPSKSLSFSYEYTPADIGDFQFIARLYDASSGALVDSQIKPVTIFANIGPFDLDVEVASKTIAIGQTLPIILKVSNMGQKGTDVDIMVAVRCITQPDILRQFTFFINADDVVERELEISTCNEIGLHNIVARVMLFNRTLVSSLNQFIISDTVPNLIFAPPLEITMNAGDSKVFDIEIANNAISAVHNAKLLVSGVPIHWVSVNPKSIPEISPQSKIVFIVNLTVPEDAEPKHYPLTFTVGSDETLVKKQSTLGISALISKPAPPSIAINLDLTTILVIIGVVGVGLIIFNKSRKREHYDRSGVLNKIRGGIR